MWSCKACGSVCLTLKKKKLRNTRNYLKHTLRWLALRGGDSDRNTRQRKNNKMGDFFFFMRWDGKTVSGNRKNEICKHQFVIRYVEFAQEKSLNFYMSAPFCFLQSETFFPSFFFCFINILNNLNLSLQLGLIY